MPHRKSKRSRGIKSSHAPCIRNSHPGESKAYHDLFVPVPKYSSSSMEEETQASLLIQHIADRLVATGYRTMALTHTVFGLPKYGVDNVDAAIPQRLFPKTGQGDPKNKDLKRKHPGYDLTYRGLRIARRLHIVAENLSDVGALNILSSASAGPKSPNGSVQMILKDYDLVSVSPRNDAAFQAACSASGADIVTLDYGSGGGVQLPYRIRATDIQAVMQRGAVFEFAYASAIMNLSKRKALAQSARALQLASIGAKAKLLLIMSSGDRRTTTGESDLGDMVLRSPGDMINLTHVVLGFDTIVAHNALGEAGSSILKRGDLRRLNRLGGNDGTTVTEEYEGASGTGITRSKHDSRKKAAIGSEKEWQSTLGPTKTTKDIDGEYGELGDGFINLS